MKDETNCVPKKECGSGLPTPTWSQVSRSGHAERRDLRLMAVCTENLDPNVVVMESAKDRV